jgi:hypothetical protein
MRGGGVGLAGPPFLSASMRSIRIALRHSRASTVTSCRKEEEMATCNFCKKQFKSEQGVKAHMRGCDEYRKSKELTASGSMPKAGPTPSVQPNASVGPDCAAPPGDFVKAMHEFSTKQETLQTPQQLRRSILQAVKAQVVDRYPSLCGSVTWTMRGDAKMAIEQQLASLPVSKSIRLEFWKFVSRSVLCNDRAVIAHRASVTGS